MAPSAPSSTPSILAASPPLKPCSPPPPNPVSASTATTAVSDATVTPTASSSALSSSTSTHDDAPSSSASPPPVTTPPRSPRTSSTISSPPYWHSPATSPVAQHNNNSSNNRLARPLPAHHHARIPSADSSSLMHALGAITLRDNEADDAPRSAACWARSVSVVDYVIIDGTSLRFPTLPRSSSSSSSSRGTTSSNLGGSFIRLPGAFVSWNIRVETLSGSFMTINKRYSEFDHFRARLVRSFPGFEAAVPELPPKSVIAKFRPKFLEKRRAGLQYFLNCILLNPEFSGSPVLKGFLFN